MNPSEIEKNKIKSTILRGTKHQECFYYNTSVCSSKIANSHSIQSKGRLSLLTNEVDGNEKLISFSAHEHDENSNIIDFKSVGLKTASTFKGFCRKHDKELFSKIEDKEFNPENPEHCFLQTYRSFASRYVNQKSIINLCKSTVEGFSEYMENDKKFMYKISLEIEKLELNKRKI